MAPSELLKDAVERAALAGHEGKSGAGLERVRLEDGRVLVVKRLSPSSDVTLLLSGGRIGRECLLWRAGVLNRLPPGVGHAVVEAWVEDDVTVIAMRDLEGKVLSWDDRLSAASAQWMVDRVATMHWHFLGDPPAEVTPLDPDPRLPRSAPDPRARGVRQRADGPGPPRLGDLRRDGPGGGRRAGLRLVGGRHPAGAGPRRGSADAHPRRPGHDEHGVRGRRAGAARPGDVDHRARRPRRDAVPGRMLVGDGLEPRGPADRVRPRRRPGVRRALAATVAAGRIPLARVEQVPRWRRASRSADPWREAADLDWWVREARTTLESEVL